MRRSRVLLTVLGGAVFALGMLIVASPSTAALVPVDAIVAALGNPYVLVAIFGVVGLAIVAAVLLARGIQGIDQSTPPDPESVYEVPHPGGSLDDFVKGGISLRQRIFGDRHGEVQHRLYAAAVETLIRVEGMTREEAQRVVDRGDWTDDETAAGFLARRRMPGSSKRLVAALRGQSSFQHGAQRAAREIARLDGGAR